MTTASTFAALLAALALAACQKQTLEPPKPQVQSTQGVQMPAQVGTADTSVPPAASVVSPATEAPRTEPPAGRSNRTLSAAQESSAMPLPGQANDHSAPLAPAPRASSP